jgi:uncharacterized membrane protein
MLHVLGLFENPRDAHSAVQDLLDTGVNRDDISVVSREDEDNKEAMYRRTDDEPSGLTTGASIGAAVGGAGGLLAGLASFAIPGIGPLIAAGPIASALAGAIGGAATGGLIGALTDLGVPEDEAKWYSENVEKGWTLVTIRTEDDAVADRAAEVLRRRNAKDVDERGAKHQASEKPTSMQSPPRKDVEVEPTHTERRAQADKE